MSVEQILFNSGMVGAFIVFAIIMRRIDSAERTKRDDQWREFMATQNSNMISYLDRERDQRKEIMGTAYRDFSSNMDRVANGLGELTKAMADHDANAQVRHERIQHAINTINGH